MSGFNITLVIFGTFSSFAYINSQWVATQGDTLQLFKMLALSSASILTSGLTTTPFDYAANVQFAYPLPQQVFVATLISSYQVTPDVNGLYTLGVIPAYMDAAGNLNESVSAIDYDNLYCSGCTFDSSSGNFNLYF
jgi:hypothetical protein